MASGGRREGGWGIEGGRQETVVDWWGGGGSNGGGRTDVCVAADLWRDKGGVQAAGMDGLLVQDGPLCELLSK